MLSRPHALLLLRLCSDWHSWMVSARGLRQKQHQKILPQEIKTPRWTRQPLLRSRPLSGHAIIICCLLCLIVSYRVSSIYYFIHIGSSHTSKETQKVPSFLSYVGLRQDIEPNWLWHPNHQCIDHCCASRTWMVLIVDWSSHSIRFFPFCLQCTYDT